MAEPLRIAFFDVDHTLLAGSTGRHFLREAVRRGLVPSRLVLALPVLYLRYMLGRLDWSEWNGRIPAFSGLEEPRVTELADAAWRSWRQALSPTMLAEIARLRSEGWRIVLATSSLDVLVRPLVNLLAVDHLVSTRLEFRDGRTTGFFVGSPAFGREKRRLVLEYAASSGASLGNCAFYSDSVNDLPLLEAVGRPVAVNPDCRLGRIARRRCWTVLRR